MHYLIIFLISMVPIIELRGAVLYAAGFNLPFIPSLLICTIGNMIPVPFIYFFARKFLVWGSQKKYLHKICTFFLEKGEKAGQKLVKATGRGGLFIAMFLFVGIPLPGTGAWTGALGASFLNMGFKSTVASVCLGVIMAGCILSGLGEGIFAFLGM